MTWCAITSTETGRVRLRSPKYCAERGIDVQREGAITYAQTERGLPMARAESVACKAAGLDVEWIDSLGDYAGLPIPFRGGVRLAGQAQFEPMPLLDATAR